MPSLSTRRTRNWPPISPLVLVVDDEDDDRDYVRRVLVHSGFTPVTSVSAADAIDLLADERNPGIAAVIVRRAGGADDVIAWRDRHAPSLGVVCITGCFDEPLEGVATVYEPFAIRELLAAVRAQIPALARTA